MSAPAPSSSPPATAADADPVRLADLTTLRVGGPARRTVVATTSAELVEAVSAADAAGEPVLLVGGGSNLVVADAGFDGVAVLVRTRGCSSDDVDACGGAFVRVAAGEDWDALVARTTAAGQSGLEAMSGIPGSTGATPVQNVGAYGAEVADVVAQVVTWDRRERRQRTMSGPECRFGYRTSVFKEDPDRFVVLEVLFQLPVADRSAPVRYAELAAALGVPLGARAPLADVRAAVLALRAGKGMVLDAADHDTWSVGSFFTNPVLTAEQAARLPADAPRHPVRPPLARTVGTGRAGAEEERVKTSAAWLVARAGFAPGTGLAGPDGAGSSGSAVTTSTKHSLALTNRGGATTADVLALARRVRAAVAERFGVQLEAEPRLVGCAL